MSREDWLNGWHRDGSRVLIETGIHCAGCGKLQGVVCFCYEEDYESPENKPNWPFEKDNCPVCSENHMDYMTISADELSNLSESVLRQALIKAKTKKISS